MYRGEFYNSISHLVGAALALVGATVLITVRAVEGDIEKLISVTVYGVSLFLLYLASTLYHSFSGRAKAVFQRLDHLAIYVLIAGTYTPFALVAVDGAQGWLLFAIVWGLAIAGVVIEHLDFDHARILPIIIYLAMGWTCIFFLDSIIAGMSPVAFNLLLAGGVVYSVGVIFYVLDYWLPWCHGVWHTFVIAGSICHYFSVFML